MGGTCARAGDGVRLRCKRFDGESEVLCLAGGSERDRLYGECMEGLALEKVL